MADFHTVLKRAVSALPDKSGPNRRAVYDKARKALLKQLQGLDPPLPAQEVTQQRLALEDAIRKLEAEIARAGRTPPPGAPLSSNAPAAARTAAPTPPARPVAPRAPAPAAPETEIPPRAVPPRPNFPTAPRAGAEDREAPRAPTTTRAPLAAPTRSGASAPTRTPEPETEAPAETGQRRREPSLGRPAPPIPDVADVDEIDAAPRETGANRGALRRSAGRDTSGRGPVAPPEAGPQDELSEEEIEAAAAEAETPEIAKSADRRGWLRRRRGAAPEPVVAPADADLHDAPHAADDGYDDEPYEDDGYDDEGYDDDAPYDDEPLAAEPGRRRSLRWLVAPLVILLILAGGAFALYSQRDAIMAMMSPSSGDTAQAPATEPSTPVSTDPESNKISDRIGAPADDGAAPVVAPDARTVKTTRVVTPRSGDAATSEAPLPGSTPAPAAEVPASATSTPAAEARPAAMTSGDFDVVLYEEGSSAAEGGNAQRGTISWNFLEESIGGQPAEPIVRATLEIPARDMTVTLLFRKNGDAALPASHLIEVEFDLPSDFSGGSIANVPGLIMKQTEAAQGNALLGASAKVSDNLFWIALSATETDQKQNLELLKTRSWIDIPLLYTNGGRAILTLNKGPDGTQAIDEALAAWSAG